VPGFVPPPHPATARHSDSGQQSQSLAGLFWPQGDPGQLRQAARAWREMERALQEVEGACQSSVNQIRAYNQGPAIEAFAGYWRKWQGGGGYFELSAQASGQLADALERYASAIEQARQKVMEIAATAATVLAIGVVLTILTVGVSDAVAAGAAAGLTAAAAAVGVELSATVATIAGTILAGAAIGAVASMTIDTAIQIEHIEVFHDQRGFDWTEFEHSVEIGVLTGGAGAGVGMATRALTPMLTEASPLLARGASSFESMPEWAQAGLRGTLLGGGMAAGVDELTTGQVNPLDVALGATSGALGDMIGTRGAGRLATSSRWPADDTGYGIQQRDLNFLGISRRQVEWWAMRLAPPGMTPAQFQEFRATLLTSLREEGIPTDQVDVRLHGSAARFFSSVLKTMPTEQELAGNPQALARLQEWFGNDANRPVHRPFDAMYRLGLDPTPSDYDLNISNSAMVERARAWWEANGRPGELIPRAGHGFLSKEVMTSAFPKLAAWHQQWSAALGRDVSYAVFPSQGPWDTVVRDGVSVHFRNTDWIVHRVP